MFLFYLFSSLLVDKYSCFIKFSYRNMEILLLTKYRFIRLVTIHCIDFFFLIVHQGNGFGQKCLTYKTKCGIWARRFLAQKHFLWFISVLTKWDVLSMWTWHCQRYIGHVEIDYIRKCNRISWFNILFENDVFWKMKSFRIALW